MVRAAIVISLLGISAPLQAEPLWRTLEAGDHPNVADEKLKAMPEVKRVKTRLRGETVREQDINMVGSGIPIFEGNFSIATAYDGLSLSRVQLASGAGCANEAYNLVAQIADQLREKYPTVLTDVPESYEYSRASLDATSTTPTSVNAMFANDSTAVLLTAEFTYEDAPRYHGGGSLAYSIYQIARASYEARANSCAGTGYRTAQIRITYATKAEVDRMLSTSREEREAEIENAKNNL